MTIYYVGKNGTDDGSHGTGPDTDAWHSLEYALEDGGLSGGDILCLEETAGYFNGDYWKTGTNNQINAVISGTGECLIKGINNNSVNIVPPSDCGSRFMVVRGNIICDSSINIFNENELTVYLFILGGAGDSTVTLDSGVYDGGENGRLWGANSNTYYKSLIIQNAEVRNFYYIGMLTDTQSIVDLTITNSRVHDSLQFVSVSNGINYYAHDTVFWNIDAAIHNLKGAANTYDVQNCLFVKNTTDLYQKVFSFSDTAAVAIRDGSYPLDGIENNIYWVNGDPSATDMSSFALGSTGDYDYLSVPISNRYIRPDGNETDGFYFPSNPKTNPVLDSNLVAFHGDSIMAGNYNSEGYKIFQMYGTISNMDYVDGPYAAIGGLTVEGGRFWIDYTMTEVSPAPKYVFVSIGVNDMNKTSTTSDMIAEGVSNILQKIINYGATPIWIGIESLAGNPPDNTKVDATNALVKTFCEKNGIIHGDVLAAMQENDDWQTDYYDDLTSNLHPNDVGATFMAQYSYDLFLKYENIRMPTAYISTGETARQKIIASGKGILIEPSRTNCAPYATNLSNWDNVWGGGTTVSKADRPSPYKGAPYECAQIDATGDGCNDALILTVDTVYTFTAALENKNAGRSAMRVWDPNNSAYIVNLEILWTDGVPSTYSVTSGVEVLYEETKFDGVWEITYSFTSSSSGTLHHIVIYPERAETNTNSIYFHFAQVEEGAFKTTPIYTDGNQVTRTKDQLNYEIDPVADEGTIYFEGYMSSADYYQQLLQIDDGTDNSNRICLCLHPNNTARLDMNGGGTSIVDILTTVGTTMEAGKIFKAAVAWKSTDTDIGAVALNGAVTTGNGGGTGVWVLPDANIFHIGGRAWGDVVASGVFKKVATFKKRLSNEEIEKLTINGEGSPLTFVIPDDATYIIVTFKDGSTQKINVTSGSTYTLDTSILNQQEIESISFGRTVLKSSGGYQLQSSDGDILMS